MPCSSTRCPGPSTTCPFPPHGWSAPSGLPLLLRKQPIWAAGDTPHLVPAEQGLPCSTGEPPPPPSAGVRCGCVGELGSHGTPRGGGKARHTPIPTPFYTGGGFCPHFGGPGGGAASAGGILYPPRHITLKRSGWEGRCEWVREHPSARARAHCTAAVRPVVCTRFRPGLRRSSVDPPLCSGRARAHAAFIAFSAHYNTASLSARPHRPGHGQGKAMMVRDDHGSPSF